MNKESKLNLNAGDYAISHCDSDKTYTGLEVHKMLCDAYIAGNNDTLESEDERIKEAIIATIHLYYGEPLEDEAKEMIAWLEKQGEKKPEENNGNIGGISPNSAWSEENEPQKELAESYLDKFDKKFPILPTLKGKRLADYKNFLNKCQQIFGLKYWGIHPTQAKLFEKLSLLWAAWGTEHLQGLGQTYGDMDDEILWSEEDESILQGIWDEILANKHDAKECEWKTYDMFLNWLKSLQGRVQPKPEWSEEEIEKAAQEWDSEANFNPFYMTMEGGKPTGVKQSITTHEESFKAGVNWILKSLRPLNAYNPYKAVVESIAEMCKHYDKASHSGLRDFYDNVKVKCNDAQEYDKMFPQAHWKPSDGQISLLQAIINEPNNAASESCQIVLKDILEQLKKLKEG